MRRHSPRVKMAAWGLMWRVSLGAVLSVSDLATDLVVLNQFWEGGEIMASFFNAQLASFTASILIQLVFVIFQHRKKGVVRILKEWFIVLVGMKAPWDAYEVAMGEARGAKRRTAKTIITRLTNPEASYTSEERRICA